MQQPIINIKNLNKKYKIYDKPSDRLKETLSPFNKKRHKEFFALENIDMSIYPGEIIGFLGKNGAGKSTLLKIITGVLEPTSGKVEVKGKISALLELGTGFNPEYTGIENIYLYGTMMGKTKKEIDNEFDEIIEFADIGQFLYQPLKTYSSGMFARLAFSVAINVNPDILIVDEILSVGDLKFQLKCMNKMKEMMSNGTTILFVSHDINAIKRFCNRAIWINEGKVIKSGDIDKVTDMYLDFLKVGETDSVIKKVEYESNIKLEKFNPTNELIAEIKNVVILNEEYELIQDIYRDKKILVEIIYDVYDENVDMPVLGVAIRSIDDEYICGLNTLLDKVDIPWKYGRNKFYLEYNYGILAVGGNYYLDVALFEETATVPIDYKSKVKDFLVLSAYDGEGKYIIPHVWRGE
jgi:ABC-type polysaccharide/polyol phosphate transport system ATPase subunit